MEDAESPLDYVLERDHKLLVEVTMGDGDWRTVCAKLISPATTLISQFGVFFFTPAGWHGAKGNATKHMLTLAVIN